MSSIPMDGLKANALLRRALLPPPLRLSRSIRRALMFSLILTAHVVVTLLVTRVAAPEPAATPTVSPEIVSFLVRPRVIISTSSGATLPPIRLPEEAPIAFSADLSDILRPTLLVAGVGTMAPRPASTPADTERYARAAGLLAGQGATVVLRVEVLPTGDVGRVEIDVSCGESRVDSAAVAYIRSLAWIPGMVDGEPVTLWLRWPVRIQA